MGCFLACFGGAKDRKRRRPAANKSLPVDRVRESYKPLRRSPSPKQLTPSLSPKKFASEAAVVSTPEPRENHEQGNFGSSKKKVTFDLNVKTYEEVLIDEDPGRSPDDDKEGEAIREERKPEEGDDKSTPNSRAFPSNHRYQNCECSDNDDSDYGEEEEEEEAYEDSDLDEEDNVVNVGEHEEESYDSFFSLPMEKEQQCIQEVSSSPKPKSVSSPDGQPSLSAKGTARDRSQYVHSVLNPVENLTQWKEAKVNVVRAAPTKNPRKENIDSDTDKFQKISSSNPSPDRRPPKPDITVDASLSTWLLSSDSSAKEGPARRSNSHPSNSSVSREERPILGALTVEDIKQSSATSSPRRSPSRSPDEIPIVGTVGSYWSRKERRSSSDSASSCRSGSEAKGIPNTTSKYREDKRVNWHSTPFEVRLERALNGGVLLD